LRRSESDRKRFSWLTVSRINVGGRSAFVFSSKHTILLFNFQRAKVNALSAHGFDLAGKAVLAQRLRGHVTL
jgi:hypothetical protein